MDELRDLASDTWWLLRKIWSDLKFLGSSVRKDASAWRNLRRISRGKATGAELADLRAWNDAR